MFFEIFSVTNFYLFVFLLPSSDQDGSIFNSEEVSYGERRDEQY